MGPCSGQQQLITETHLSWVILLCAVQAVKLLQSTQLMTSTTKTTQSTNLAYSKGSILILLIKKILRNKKILTTDVTKVSDYVHV